MDSVKVGLIGFGTVGKGVVRVLQQNADIITERLGFPPRARADRGPGHDERPRRQRRPGAAHR